MQPVLLSFQCFFQCLRSRTACRLPRWSGAQLGESGVPGCGQAEERREIVDRLPVLHVWFFQKTVPPPHIANVLR